MSLLSVTDRGLYCAEGDFHIDPIKPVANALITHAHADHARQGHQRYWAVDVSVPILKHRLGSDIAIEDVGYGQPIEIGGTQVSFHSAGHVLGSAQIRVEADGEVWVVSGDYKRAEDPTCAPFEVVPCDTFITEATFGLPVYHWESGAETARQILAWQQAHPDRTCVLFCYAFGKAQRVLAELARHTDETVYLHGAMEAITDLYRQAGVEMVPTGSVSAMPKGHDFRGNLVLAPPSAHRSAWLKRFKKLQTGFASGWMRVRGNRRRRGYERGFVLSDHADWPALIQTVRETGAGRVLVTHGQDEVLARYLREQLGIEAAPLGTIAAGA